MDCYTVLASTFTASAVNLFYCQSRAISRYFRGIRGNSCQVSLKTYLAYVVDVLGGCCNLFFVSTLLWGLWDNFAWQNGNTPTMASANSSVPQNVTEACATGPATDWIFVLVYLAVTCVLKLVHVGWLTYRQCCNEIRVIDHRAGQLEQPGGSSGSALRRSAIVQCLRHLQQERAISPFSLFSLGSLAITGVELHGGLSITSDSSAYRNITVMHTVFVLVGVMICVTRKEFHRLISGQDPVKELTNLCRWLNCSVFIRTHNLFAYYIANTTTIPEPAKPPKQNGRRFTFHGERGAWWIKLFLFKDKYLARERCGSEQASPVQTHTLALPDQFAVLHRDISSQSSSLPTKDSNDVEARITPADEQLLPDIGAKAVGLNAAEKNDMDGVKFVNDVNEFLLKFLSHQSKTIDYTTRRRVGSEKYFNTEQCICGVCGDNVCPIVYCRHRSPTKCRCVKMDKVKAPGKGKKVAPSADDHVGVMFYDPDLAFLNEFFLGHTCDLFTLEVLLFTWMKLVTNSCLIAGVSTVLMGWLLSGLRIFFGNLSLQKSTGVVV